MHEHVAPQVLPSFPAEQTVTQAPFSHFSHPYVKITPALLSIHPYSTRVFPTQLSISQLALEQAFPCVYKSLPSESVQVAGVMDAVPEIQALFWHPDAQGVQVSAVFFTLQNESIVPGLWQK